MANLGKTWGNLPSNYTEFKVTDTNGNDVLDRTNLQDGILFFPLSLQYYTATCEDGSKVRGESLLPTKIPTLNFSGPIYSGTTSYGLYPNDDGQYYFEIAAPFEIDIYTNDKIKPYLHEIKQCNLDKPIHEFYSIYHVSYGFNLLSEN
jgi:hypothetical protein